MHIWLTVQRHHSSNNQQWRIYWPSHFRHFPKLFICAQKRCANGDTAPLNWETNILKYKTENLTKIIILFCPVRKIINLYKIFFLTLRNIILKYKTENLTKIILLFCPVRKIINLYKICILMLRKKILQNKIIWSSSIKKTGYIENVSIWFFIKVTI